MKKIWDGTTLVNLRIVICVLILLNEREVYSILLSVVGRCTFKNRQKKKLLRTFVNLHDGNLFPVKGLFTWSGGPRSSGVGFFCFHALEDTKQKKPTPLDRGPPLHVNRVLLCLLNSLHWLLVFLFPPELSKTNWKYLRRMGTSRIKSFKLFFELSCF